MLFVILFWHCPQYLTARAFKHAEGSACHDGDVSVSVMVLAVFGALVRCVALTQAVGRARRGGEAPGAAHV